MTRIIGIDPGKTGALAYMNGSTVKLYPFDDMSEQDIAELIESFAGVDAVAYLEKVNGFPDQGRAGIFTFGQGYGVLRGCLHSQRIPFHDVPPQTWQKALGLGKNYGSKPDRKKAHRAQAQQWYPRLNITLAAADALLIAEYGRRLHLQKEKPSG